MLDAKRFPTFWLFLIQGTKENPVEVYITHGTIPECTRAMRDLEKPTWSQKYLHLRLQPSPHRIFTLRTSPIPHLKILK